MVNCMLCWVRGPTKKDLRHFQDSKHYDRAQLIIPCNWCTYKEVKCWDINQFNILHKTRWFSGRTQSRKSPVTEVNKSWQSFPIAYGIQKLDTYVTASVTTHITCLGMPSTKGKSISMKVELMNAHCKNHLNTKIITSSNPTEISNSPLDHYRKYTFTGQKYRTIL